MWLRMNIAHNEPHAKAPDLEAAATAVATAPSPPLSLMQCNDKRYGVITQPFTS